MQLLTKGENINWIFLFQIWIPCLVCVSIKYSIRFLFQAKINKLEEKSLPTLIDVRDSSNVK